jgi:release factor glutamine methyltransferase
VTTATLQPGTTVAAARRAIANVFRDVGIESPELDARLLIGHALGLEHAALVSDAERKLTANEIAQIESFAARRLKHEPVAHILGRKEFWGLELQVNGDVLVPRPETETIIEAALELLAGRRNALLRIVDLGTGSGALLIALLHEFPNATGIGTDISERAIDIARANAWKHGLNKRADFVLCNYGTALPGAYDLVVSNPPYIRSNDIAGLAPDVKNYDPRLALDGGADGLDAYRAIAADARRLVVPGGFMVLEVGAGQAGEVGVLLAKVGLSVRQPPRPDMAGIPRAVVATHDYVSG